MSFSSYISGQTSETFTVPAIICNSLTVGQASAAGSVLTDVAGNGVSSWQPSGASAWSGIFSGAVASITTTANALNALLLNSSGGPAATTLIETTGTSPAAIQLTASAGGINLNASGPVTTNKLTIAQGPYGAGWVWTDVAGVGGVGSWVAAAGAAWNGIFTGATAASITSSVNANNAILLHATGGAASEVNVVNDAGTGTGAGTSAINILASAGDISLTAQPFGEVILGSYLHAQAGFIGPPSANFAVAQNGAMIGQGLSLGVTSWAGGTYGVVLAGGPWALTLPPVSAVVNGVELTLFVAGISNAAGNDLTVTCGGGDYEGVLVRGAAAGVEALNSRTTVTFHDDAPGTGAQIGDQITFRCTGLKWVYSGVAENLIGMVVS